MTEINNVQFLHEDKELLGERVKSVIVLKGNNDVVVVIGSGRQIVKIYDIFTFRLKKCFRIKNNLENSVCLLETTHPYLLLRHMPISFTSKLEVYDPKQNYQLLTYTVLEGYQKPEACIISHSPFMLYCANPTSMQTDKRFMYVYNYTNFQQVSKIKIKQIAPLMCLEDSRHYSSGFMMEDSRVLKIRKLIIWKEYNFIENNFEITESSSKTDDQPLFQFQDVKQLELKELKEKKAIYMGTQDSKVFYRVQNMGIIIWDFETDEVQRIKLNSEGGTFYSAVGPFSIPSFHPISILGTEIPKKYLIIAKMENPKPQKGPTTYFSMLYDLSTETIVHKFENTQAHYTFEGTQNVKSIDTIDVGSKSNSLVFKTNILFIQDILTSFDWSSYLDKLEVESGFQLE